MTKICQANIKAKIRHPNTKETIPEIAIILAYDTFLEV